MSKIPASPFDWLVSQQSDLDAEAAAANKQAIHEHNLAALEEARLFADVFLHGRGPELLQLLRDRTIELPLMDVSRSTVRGELALSPADWAYIREGQNSIVRMIEAQIRTATMPLPEAPAQHEGNDDA